VVFLLLDFISFPTFRLCHLLYPCHCIFNATNFSCNVLFSGLTYILFWDFMYSCLLTYEQVYFIRFEVSRMVRIKTTVICDVIPCSIRDTYQCFRGICCLHCWIEEQNLPKCWYLPTNLTASLSTTTWNMYFIWSTHKFCQSCTAVFHIIFTSPRYGHTAEPWCCARIFLRILPFVQNALESYLTLFQMLLLNCIFTRKLSWNRNFERVGWWLLWICDSEHWF
jgi:hypothetical protein